MNESRKELTSRESIEKLPYPGFDWLIVRHPGDDDFTWTAYRPAPYLEPTERLTGTASTSAAARVAAEEALRWVTLFRCSCGREVWQRPELWSGTCHACSDDCLMRGHR